MQRERISINTLHPLTYVQSGSLESFSGLQVGVGLLDLFNFSLHEDIVSGGGTLFLGGG